MISETKRKINNSGFTIVEVVMVIIIAAILVTIAMKSVVTVTETGRVEETKREMEQLTWAICGNPELENNGVRTDFGYVGDVGSLPAGLDSLYIQPSGYTTWNGPYVSRRYQQITDDYKEDAWGVAYTYTGGIEITSSGSGSDIVRRLANSEDDLLRNKVTGIILDRDGAPPGSDECDTVDILLTIPNGVGSTATKSTHPEPSGYFEFDSIPIGNHDIRIVYMPIDDTLHRFVSVLPNSVLYQEYFLTFSPWSEVPPVLGCFEYVAGSAQTIGGVDCDGLRFQIRNTCGVPSSVTAIKLDYVTSPVSYYQNVQWNGQAAFNGNPSRAASGDWAVFQEPNDVKWADGGETVTIDVEQFRDTQETGGAAVAMNNVDITVELSDGSTFSFNTGPCTGDP